MSGALDPAAAERTLLAGLMLDARAVWEVEGLVRPGDFADGRHATIYEALTSLAEHRAPTDVLAVSARLERDGHLRIAGGSAYLHEVAGEAFTGANATYYAHQVRSAALKRRVREAGLSIVEWASGEGDAAEIAERARSEIEAAASATAPGDLAPIGEGLDAVLDSLSVPPRYVETPWTEINRLIGGFRPGGLYVIGARPGSGKTIMGLQAAASLARHGRVAYSSLEMGTAELTKRLIALTASVRLSSLVNSQVADSEWRKIATARSAIASLPLIINDRAGVTIQDVRSFARSVARRGPIAGVVVDYLQMLRPLDARKPRWESIGEVSGALKALARDLDVPVIALAQLNRGTEGSNRLPTLGDLRESGNIEQDADVVMLLQREWNPASEAFTDTLNVVVAKNRHGTMGSAALFWEAHYARVSDLVPDGAPR